MGLSSAAPVVLQLANAAGGRSDTSNTFTSRLKPFKGTMEEEAAGIDTGSLLSNPQIYRV